MLHELAETDDASEPVSLNPYTTVELVSRPQTSLTPFERVFLEIPETDVVATTDGEREVGGADHPATPRTGPGDAPADRQDGHGHRDRGSQLQ